MMKSLQFLQRMMSKTFPIILILLYNSLSSLDINVLPKFIIYVVIFMSLVLLVSLIISSFNILRRNPKELLIDNN